MNFTYKARDKTGQIIRGKLAAASSEQVARHLIASGITPIEIKAEAAALALSGLARITLVDIHFFTRQLMNMVGAGIPVTTSLGTIAEQLKNERFQKIILAVQKDINTGLSLSEALGKYQSVFGDLYIGMVMAGEQAGVLVDILKRLCDLLEYQIDINARVKAAVRYPIFTLATLAVAFIILVVFVFPKWATIYSQFNFPLPLPTRILILTSTITKKWWYLILGALAAAVYLFRSWLRTPRGRLIWDGFTLKMPVFGQLFVMTTMSRFSRITAMLFHAGLPIVEILDLTGRTVGNKVVAQALGSIKESVKAGHPLNEPMKVSGLFPPAVTQMVATGEETGNLDDLLFSVASYYDNETNYLIRNLTTYIEPIFIFILGMMVLLVALGVFLPMWRLITAVRGAA